MQDHPEIQALEWIPIVSIDERVKYEESAKNDGYTQFSIREYDENNQLISAKNRPEYYLAYYVEPLKGNEEALGYDLGSSIARLNALKKAASQNTIVITEPITLVQEKEHQQAILVIHPLFGKSVAKQGPQQQSPAILGYVLMVMRMNDFFYHAISSVFYDQGISISITDQETDLWMAGDKVGFRKELNQHYQEHLITIGQRAWKLVASAPYYFLNNSHDNEANTTLLLSLLTSFIFAIYIHTLKQQNYKISKQVNICTKELQESQACYKAIIDTAVDGIISIDRSGNVSQFNQSAVTLFGYRAEEIIGRNVSVLMDDEQAIRHNPRKIS